MIEFMEQMGESQTDQKAVLMGPALPGYPDYCNDGRDVLAHGLLTFDIETAFHYIWCNPRGPRSAEKESPE